MHHIDRSVRLPSNNRLVLRSPSDAKIQPPFFNLLASHLGRLSTGFAFILRAIVFAAAIAAAGIRSTLSP